MGGVYVADRSCKTPGREADAPSAVEADAWKRRWMRRESSTLPHPADHIVPKKPVVESRWVLTWEGVDGRTPARDGMVANCFEDPDPGGGLAETVGSSVWVRSDPSEIAGVAVYTSDGISTAASVRVLPIRGCCRERLQTGTLQAWKSRLLAQTVPRSPEQVLEFQDPRL